MELTLSPIVDVTRGRWRGILAVALVVWTVFAAICTATVLWGMRDHGHSPALITLYELLVWWGWALATPAIAWLGRRVPLVPLTARAAVVHAGVAIAVALGHCAWWALLLVVLQPFDAMGAQTFGVALAGIVSVPNLFLELALYVAVLGVSYAADYQRRLRARELREAQLETHLANARLDALELQLQPHFLFNTLHAIGGLVRQRRGDEAVEMIAGLSDLLRYSLEHAGKHLVPLAQELAITERYLEIQRCRFSDRLAVTVDVPADTRRALVPALVLQPLVENAVRHGIERMASAGTIELRARRDDDRLVLEVLNTGPEPVEADAGIGIANTRARLRQLYGPRHAFELRARQDGVVAAIALPYEEAPA